MELFIYFSSGIKITDYIIQDMLFSLHMNSMDHLLLTLKKHLRYVNDISVYMSDDLSMKTGKERTSNPLVNNNPIIWGEFSSFNKI